MVSFSCENCGDVLTKKKLDPHRNRCRGATFTCIDCMVYFHGTDYRSHTSCITEDQKYQGALYKNKKQKPNPPPSTTPKAEMASAVLSQSISQPQRQSAYVEDVADGFEDYEDLEDRDGKYKSDDNRLPHAPTPPRAPEEGVNVFDFLVQNGATPNASNVGLPRDESIKPSESTQLVRFDYGATAYLDDEGIVVDDEKQLVQYGSGPIPHAPYETPAPKSERRRKDGEKEHKKDKKRKRLHVDTHDSIMTDAPPMLHSGLTGGLNRLMSRPGLFPPSPDYSADAAETPASPLKKSRHHKHSKGKSDSIGNNLMSLLTSGSRTRPAKKHHKKSSSSSRKHSSSSKSTTAKTPKLIEYRPNSRDSKDEGDGQMVVYKPRADLLLSLVNKGPESERGCSMNKALKRFHRERSASGTSLGKLSEEKELWRSLRMRKNERGEIVLFCV